MPADDTAGSGELFIEGTPLEIVQPAHLSIGSVDGAEADMLHDVGAPSRLPDGSVVVPLRRAGEIRIFRPDGTFVMSHGRTGAGPGEFQGLRAAWTRGDTIEAWDSGLYRITRFLPDGKVSVVQPGHGRERQTSLGSFVGAVSDGWLISSVLSAGWGQRDVYAVYRFGMDGTPGGAPVVEAFGMDRYRTERWGGPTPLSPAAKWHVHAPGREPGNATEALHVSHTLSARIEVVDLSGGPGRTIRWEPANRWTPQDAFDAVVQVIEAAGGDRVERIRAAPPPDSVPVFSDFLVDDEGFTWIRSFEPERDAAIFGANVGTGRTGPGGEWQILSPAGEQVGSVDMPAGFTPHRITADEVLGIYRDDLDVEFVRAYALRRH